MESPSVLEIDDVTIHRERRCVLSRVSMTVAAGSVHLLVGPNGAGKSTLFAAVLGLVDFSGQIHFRWRGNGRIGYVPQSFSVDRTLPLTVGEFLALSRRRRPVCLGIGRKQHQRGEQLLARVGLAGFASRPLGALSGGEQQRVLLANAIDPQPELLLLDEPGSGLDEGATEQFESVLVELARDTATGVLMVSHDALQIRRLADRVTFIDKTVRRSGTVADVLTPAAARTLAAESWSP